ncbi:MAG: hypothetical protein ACMUEK_00100 [Sodalis sp. (in: enterobacteria)]
MSREQFSGTRRKKPNFKKKHSLTPTSKTMYGLGVSVLIMFIGFLYFIAHNKSNEMMIMPNHTEKSGCGIPPKPQERWRYIKKLENRQLGIQPTPEVIPEKEITSPAKLNKEQRQLLDLLQSDMRQNPIPINKAQYNNQKKTPVVDSVQLPKNSFNQESQHQPISNMSGTNTVNSEEH